MPLRRFLEGEDDERQDDQTRRRVRELAAGMQAWAVKQERRMHVFGLLLTLMVIGALISVALGYALLQGQRWDTLRDSCERTNRQAEATVGLLEDLRVRHRVILIAKVRYPHTPPLAHREGDRLVEGAPPDAAGPMTCADYASQNVGWPRL